MPIWTAIDQETYSARNALRGLMSMVASRYSPRTGDPVCIEISSSNPEMCRVAPRTLISDAPINVNGREFLKTKEASAYLRKSVSWLVKRNDIPYQKGTPNIYRRKDLDAWYESNKFHPSLN